MEQPLLQQLLLGISLGGLMRHACVQSEQLKTLSNEQNVNYYMEMMLILNCSKRIVSSILKANGKLNHGCYSDFVLVERGKDKQFLKYIWL